MPVVNRYILKNLLIATVFITLALSSVIVLTQSLRFLELIIESGAGVGSFWTLTFLALPRFMEILIPIAAMIAVLFIYNKLHDSSELVILSSSGLSPLRIARPALFLACGLTCFLWFMTLWAAPSSLAKLQLMRQTIRSQLSVFYLQEGIFNQLGDDYMLYIQRREDNGDLGGLLMYDQSDEEAGPAVVLAQSGRLVQSEDGYQIHVTKGSRQSYDSKTRILQRLDFDHYTVELPMHASSTQRWKEPDERTILQLLNPDMEVLRDREHLGVFKLEVHRRIAAPLLCFAYILMAAAVLILSPVRRGNQTTRMVGVVLGVVTLQGLFMGFYNSAQAHPMLGWFLYLIAFIPAAASLYALAQPEKLSALQRRFKAKESLT